MFVFYIYAGVLLGILIIVHEIGHFVAARLAGVTVERFSIGFGPRILTMKRGETEYAISLIPLGGYVKMAGMDPTQGNGDEPPGPNTFLGKRIAVRALIVASGPVMNFVWAVIVMIGLFWIGGIATLGEPILGEIEAGSPAAAAGLLTGDRIVSVDGQPVELWDDVYGLLSERDEGPIEFLVERGADGTEAVPVTVETPPDTAGQLLGITPFVPPVIGQVMRGGPADRAGLTDGDRVISIAGTPVDSWFDLSGLIYDRAGEEIEIIWERDGERMSAVVTPEQGEEPDGAGGVRRVGLINILMPWTVRKIGLGEAIGTGVSVTVDRFLEIAEFFVMLIPRLIRGELSAETLGGPIRVVQLASESARWGADFFFGFMAVMSLNLFVINLLPLPILDGGHLLLMVLERVRGRRLTDRQLMVWQQVGLVFFAGLMIALIYLDVFRGR
jgi:regulator of sigma E protease